MDKRVARIEEDDSLDDGRKWAVLKPGFVLRGYATHAFTYETREEYRGKLKLIKSCGCISCVPSQ